MLFKIVSLIYNDYIQIQSKTLFNNAYIFENIKGNVVNPQNTLECVK